MTSWTGISGGRYNLSVHSKTKENKWDEAKTITSAIGAGTINAAQQWQNIINSAHYEFSRHNKNAYMDLRYNTFGTKDFYNSIIGRLTFDKPTTSFNRLNIGKEEEFNKLLYNNIITSLQYKKFKNKLLKLFQEFKIEDEKFKLKDDKDIVKMCFLFMDKDNGHFDEIQLIGHFLKVNNQAAIEALKTTGGSLLEFNNFVIEESYLSLYAKSQAIINELCCLEDFNIKDLNNNALLIMEHFIKNDSFASYLLELKHNQSIDKTSMFEYKYEQTDLYIDAHAKNSINKHFPLSVLNQPYKLPFDEKMEDQVSESKTLLSYLSTKKVYNIQDELFSSNYKSFNPDILMLTTNKTCLADTLDFFLRHPSKLENMKYQAFFLTDRKSVV